MPLIERVKREQCSGSKSWEMKTYDKEQVFEKDSNGILSTRRDQCRLEREREREGGKDGGREEKGGREEEGGKSREGGREEEGGREGGESVTMR